MLAVHCQSSFIFFQERKDKRRHGAEEKPLPSNQVLLVTVTRAKPKPLIDPTANPITAKAAKEPERV
jgi:hypothetical protein